MSHAAPSIKAAILTRLIDPSNGSWSAEAARAILTIELPADDRARLNELAANARDGSLSAEETAELESYRRVGRFLELMKAKARLSLDEVASHSEATDSD